MDDTVKTLLIIGAVFILFGLIWHFSGGKIPLGRLPGDIRFEGEHSRVFIPITTCLLLSAVFSLVAYFFRK